MATDQTNPSMTTSQVTTNFTGPPTLSEANRGDSLYPPKGPAPAGTRPEAIANMKRETSSYPQMGVGIEGEEVVWEGRYVLKNFFGRLLTTSLATVAWMVLALYAWWNHGGGGLALATVVLGIALGLFWVTLFLRIMQARYGHYYRLTTRRLFVSTGLMRRRRDMLELLRVKDVYTRQNLVERWLSIGTVVVITTDDALPMYYLAGVDDPKGVLDLVWHHARAERDLRSVKVESV